MRLQQILHDAKLWAKPLPIQSYDTTGLSGTMDEEETLQSLPSQGHLHRHPNQPLILLRSPAPTLQIRVPGITFQRLVRCHGTTTIRIRSAQHDQLWYDLTTNFHAKTGFTQSCLLRKHKETQQTTGVNGHIDNRNRLLLLPSISASITPIDQQVMMMISLRVEIVDKRSDSNKNDRRP